MRHLSRRRSKALVQHMVQEGKGLDLMGKNQDILLKGEDHVMRKARKRTTSIDTVVRNGVIHNVFATNSKKGQLLKSR